MTYKELTFSIPELKGISKTSIDEHLKLYAGYVKHTNLILEKIEQYKDSPDNAYELTEIRRRFSFEFDGMRNHEYYFKSLEGGATELQADSELKKAIEAQWGSMEAWLAQFKTIAMTRGVGWAILYYDAQQNVLLNNWNDEQHLGHLMSLSPVLALDMWEHSFVADYQPSGKKNYVEDFFKNLNWSVIEANFLKARKA